MVWMVKRIAAGDGVRVANAPARAGLRLSDENFFSHVMVVGGSGAGKTELIKFLLRDHLQRSDASVMIIDSQGDLLRAVSRVKLFAGTDRLLVMDAAASHPPALGLFDMGRTLSELSAHEREVAINHKVQLVKYVLGALFGSELTPQTETVLEYLGRLMLSTKEPATIHTLLRCLTEPGEFADDIAKLPATAQLFFAEFMAKGYTVHRKALQRRLFAVLGNPLFEKIFASPKSAIDVARELDRPGRVLFVNTSRATLPDGFRILGRYFIAQALQAAVGRARMKDVERVPCFVIIDEGADYFDGNDTNLGDFLTQARKYKMGLTLSLQSLSQLPMNLSAVLMANTGCKLVSGVSEKDARAMAAEMRCKPEQIMGMQRDRAGANFAAYVRGQTASAVSWYVPFGSLEKLGVLSAAEHRQLLEGNHRVT